MSEVLKLYGKEVEITYFIELYFNDSPEPDCSISPVLGPEIIKKNLEEVRAENVIEGYEDYIIPIVLMDATAKCKGYITSLFLCEDEAEDSTEWQIIFGFNNIFDFDEFQLTSLKNLGDLREHVAAGYDIRLSVEDRSEYIQDAESVITTDDLAELSSKFNKLALEEFDDKKAELFSLLDFIFSEINKEKGHLINFVRIPTDSSFNEKLLFVINFEEFPQFRFTIGEIEHEAYQSSPTLS